MSARPYRTALRDEHARLTRRRLVDAAIELFAAHGYAATTVDAIAERADVSRRTVFSAVGGKSALLKLAFDRTLAGDDEPVAIADRPDVKLMMRQPDPNRLLTEWIAMNAAIAERIAALHRIVAVAADHDPDAAALLADTDRQRAEGTRALVHRLGELGGLRPGLEAEHAAAIADTLIDPCLHRRLVDIHHWSFEQYLTFLQHLAATSLLAGGSTRRATGEQRTRRRREA